MLVCSIFQIKSREELKEEKVMFFTKGSNGALYITLCSQDVEWVILRVLKIGF